MYGFLLSNDARMKHAQSYLAHNGIETTLCNDVPQTIKHAVDFVVLPLSGIDKDGCIQCNGKKQDITSFLHHLPKKTVIFTGQPADSLQSFRTFHLFDSEKFAKRNSELTAEGVLYLILDSKKKALDQYSYDVIGYGRCGKAIVTLFSALALKVRIISHTLANGCYTINHHAVPIIDLHDYANIVPADIIINTAPQRIITRKMVEDWHAHPLLIDISSRHVGADADITPSFAHVVKAASLPTIVAEEEAGRILAETIIERMQI